MKTFTVIFELLIFYPICVYLYQVGIKKIGGNIALRDAGNALIAEIKFCLKPIMWLFTKHNFAGHKKEEPFAE